MANVQQELQERLSFYMKAYQQTEKTLQNDQKSVKELEGKFEDFGKSIANNWLGEDIDEQEKELLQSKLGIDWQQVKAEMNRKEKSLQADIQQLKKTPFYQEYLDMMMSDEVGVVAKMEADGTFMYMLNQNFHNQNFVNEPSIWLLGFHYQPRFWKFRKIANLKAKEYFFENYVKMFEFWNNVRQSFNSLLGDAPIKEAIAKGQETDKKVSQKQEELNILPSQEVKLVVEKVVEMLEVVDTKNITMFSSSERDNLLALREQFDQKEQAIQQNSERLTAISKNMGMVEEMLQKAEFINTESDGYQAFLKNNDPTKPIFEMIPENEWIDIKKAFEEKGIQLKNRENYSVVKTKLTQEQEDYYKKKYNVKEGEIFFDENLM